MTWRVCSRRLPRPLRCLTLPPRYVGDATRAAGVVEEPLSLGHKLASNADTYDGIWLRTDGQPPSVQACAIPLLRSRRAGD